MKRLKIILQSKKFILFSLFFLFIYVFLFTKVIKYESKYNYTDTEIIGVITNYSIHDNNIQILLQAKEKIQVVYYFDNINKEEDIINKIKLGNKVKLHGSLVKPNNNTIPNTFNYKKYLHNKKIYWVLRLDRLEVIKENKNIFYTLKNIFMDKIKEFKASSYMYAFILGNSDYILKDTYNTFKDNGVIHLFSVSGMHIGIFAMFINSFLKRFKVKDNYIFIIIVFLLLFYLFLTNFTPSGVRAFLLFLFIFINKKFDLKFKKSILLYIIFLILLIINPFYIYDLGFIYSFVITFGLILNSKKIKGNYFICLFKTSLIAFLYSLPITIFSCYEFNLLTILNNIIIVPLISLFLFPLTLITFIFPFFESILNMGFIILEVINIFLNRIAIMITVPKISFIFAIIYYFILYLFYKYSYKVIILLVILLFNHYVLKSLDNNQYVYYLDVGQGDSSLIITEHKKDVILIDSGGLFNYKTHEMNYRYADNILLFLKSLGITKIDLFVGTHGDTDHIGYATYILNEIKPKKIMLNYNSCNQDEKYLASTYKVYKEDIYKGKNILLQNLNKNISDDENISSLVLALKLKDKTFLFMGDAPKEVEKDLIEHYDLKDIALLKVGHHGSKTSTSKEFINSINPKYSIISVGKNNRYGHPNKDVLENLNNSKIYRTDIDGSIIFKFKKGKLDIGICPP